MSTTRADRSWGHVVGLRDTKAGTTKLLPPVREASNSKIKRDGKDD